VDLLACYLLLTTTGFQAITLYYTRLIPFNKETQMKKILLNALGILLVTAFSTSYAVENSNNNVVKAPPADEMKAPPANVKAVPRTRRDNEDTQPTQEALQPCEGIPSVLKVDPRVQEFLTCDIIQILAQPERVESFRLKPKPNASLPDKNRLGNYPIEENGQGRNLSQTELNNLQTLFWAENSYFFKASKRCRFRPDIGLHFVKGEQSVEVLFSFSCNLWLFFYKGEEKLEDFDRVQAQLLKLDNSLFPPAQTPTAN